MSEIVLFRLNQMPDRFYTKFLELVGIRRFPASAARTEVTFWLSSELAEPVEIPAGTEVSTTTGDGSPGIVFATTDPLRISQPELVAAVTAPEGETERFVDVWDSIRFELEGVACFTSEPIAAGDGLYLGFEGTLAGNVIQIDVGASIEGIGIDPDRPPLRWQVWDGDGWVPCDVYSDTTGGLNRDGTVTLVVGLKHAPLTLGTAAPALVARRAWSTLPPGQPGYETSPVVRGLRVASIGGTVTAEHSRNVDEEYLGPLERRRWPVLRRPEHPGDAAPPRARRRVIVRDRGTEQRWTEVDDFTRSDRDDLHFVWDSGSGTVTFGPRIRYPRSEQHPGGEHRQHGAVPPAGVGDLRHRVPLRGRSDRQHRRRDDHLAADGDPLHRPGDATATPAFGGVDEETVENAKRRGPMTLRTGERAVTASDYERLALEAEPAVARSRCLPPLGPGKPVRLLDRPEARKRVPANSRSTTSRCLIVSWRPSPITSTSAGCSGRASR